MKMCVVTFDEETKRIDWRGDLPIVDAINCLLQILQEQSRQQGIEEVKKSLVSPPLEETPPSE